MVDVVTWYIQQAKRLLLYTNHEPPQTYYVYDSFLVYSQFKSSELAAELGL